MPLVVSGKPLLPFHKLPPEVLDILAKYTASLRLMTHLIVVHNNSDLHSLAHPNRTTHLNTSRLLCNLCDVLRLAKVIDHDI